MHSMHSSRLTNLRVLLVHESEGKMLYRVRKVLPGGVSGLANIERQHLVGKDLHVQPAVLVLAHLGVAVRRLHGGQPIGTEERIHFVVRLVHAVKQLLEPGGGRAVGPGRVNATRPR